jgi:dUTP pyrophosphatase
MEPEVWAPKGTPILQYAVAEGYDTKEPVRGSEHAAGMDVFIPNPTYQFTKDYWEKNGVTFTTEEERRKYYEKGIASEHPFLIRVNAHSKIIIPTGLRFNIPEGTYLEVANRGSMAAKEGMIFGAHIIDSDFVGVVFINLINTTSGQVMLTCGQKIAQLIHKEYIRSKLIRIPESNIRTTTRGDGALGSTGK